MASVGNPPEYLPIQEVLCGGRTGCSSQTGIGVEGMNTRAAAELPGVRPARRPSCARVRGSVRACTQLCKTGQAF